jgi:hypothetical protein
MPKLRVAHISFAKVILFLILIKCPLKKTIIKKAITLPILSLGSSITEPFNKMSI